MLEPVSARDSVLAVAHKTPHATAASSAAFEAAVACPQAWDWQQVLREERAAVASEVDVDVAIRAAHAAQLVCARHLRRPDISERTARAGTAMVSENRPIHYKSVAPTHPLNTGENVPVAVYLLLSHLLLQRSRRPTARCRRRMEGPA